MPKLKTFVTQSGFFELAVAAPSIKAATGLLGTSPIAFKHGFAKQTQDAAVIAATVARPGTVLRRPVGGKGKFTEHAALPAIPALPPGRKPAVKTLVSRRSGKTAQADAAEATAAAKAAALRQKAAAALQRAEARHEVRQQRLQDERARLNAAQQKEDDRWEKEKQRLQAKL